MAITERSVNDIESVLVGLESAVFRLQNMLKKAKGKEPDKAEGKAVAKARAEMEAAYNHRKH